MKVSQIMTARARCIAADNTLVEAAGLMRQLDVGALPVCDLDRLIGMVTDRDIVLRGVADGRDANSATVSEVMSQGAFHIYADQSVEEAAELMEDKQVRRLPVLDRQKRLVGIVSLGDLAVCSQPAFSGIALKEVSLSPQQRMSDQTPRRRIRSERTETSGARRATKGSAPRPARKRTRRKAATRQARSRTRKATGRGARRAGRAAR
jgi:CBS domain-containing protein